MEEWDGSPAPSLLVAHDRAEALQAASQLGLHQMWALRSLIGALVAGLWHYVWLGAKTVQAEHGTGNVGTAGIPRPRFASSSITSGRSHPPERPTSML